MVSNLLKIDYLFQFDIIFSISLDIYRTYYKMSKILLTILHYSFYKNLKSKKCLFIF